MGKWGKTRKKWPFIPATSRLLQANSRHMAVIAVLNGYAIIAVNSAIPIKISVIDVDFRQYFAPGYGVYPGYTRIFSGYPIDGERLFRLFFAPFFGPCYPYVKTLCIFLQIQPDKKEINGFRAE